MLLLAYTPIEKFNFTTKVFTFEKRITRKPCYTMEILRRRKGEISIAANYETKTVTINGKEFKTSINREFTYKKTRGNNIEVNSFDSFVKFLRESSNWNDVFHHRVIGFLLTLTGNKYTTISN